MNDGNTIRGQLWRWIYIHVIIMDNNSCENFLFFHLDELWLTNKENLLNWGDSSWTKSSAFEYIVGEKCSKKARESDKDDKVTQKWW